MVYRTVTLIFRFLLPDFTVMYVAPFFFAVMIPFPDTEAIFFLLLWKVAFSLEVSGSLSQIMRYFSPFFRVIAVFPTFSFFVFTLPFWTLISHFAVAPLCIVTVIVVFPVFLAVIFPVLALTTAAFLFELLQLATASPAVYSFIFNAVVLFFT